MAKVYIVALVLVVLAELIGFVRWTPIEKITILLVPFVHTIWLAVLFAPQAAGRWVKVYTISDSTWAAGIILTATYPLMVRYGTLVGPNVPKLMQAGVALILQEAGNNWGSIVIAMPIAILLGLRREVIGACFSVAREPNLSLVADIYGLDSPEGRGVIGTYITGTVLGTAFFSIRSDHRLHRHHLAGADHARHALFQRDPGGGGQSQLPGARHPDHRLHQPLDRQGPGRVPQAGLAHRGGRPDHAVRGVLQRGHHRRGVLADPGLPALTGC